MRIKKRMLLQEIELLKDKLNDEHIARLTQEEKMRELERYVEQIRDEMRWLANELQ